MDKKNSFKEHNLRAAELFGALHLKEMDAAMLLAELMILIETKLIAKVDYDRTTSAISFASYLHRNDMRANRAHLPQTPYIEHPLRNTIRAIRLGVDNEAIIIACLLHDTIEDHCEDIVKLFMKIDTSNMDESKIRETALNYITEIYGAEVSMLVDAVSNPIKLPNLTAEDKIIIYYNHFRLITNSPSAVLVKIMDLIDNAGSLHLTASTLGAGPTAKRANKYLLTVSHIADNIQDYGLQTFLTDEQIVYLRERFKVIEIQLLNLI